LQNKALVEQFPRKVGDTNKVADRRLTLDEAKARNAEDIELEDARIKRQRKMRARKS